MTFDMLLPFRQSELRSHHSSATSGRSIAHANSVTHNYPFIKFAPIVVGISFAALTIKDLLHRLLFPWGAVLQLRFCLD